MILDTTLLIVWHLTCRKLVALFGLAQQLLSRQQHYDWGLRALKTCLAISGRLLREHRAAGQQLNQVSETQIIIRGVRLATTPKLTFDDASRYLQKPAMNRWLKPVSSAHILLPFPSLVQAVTLMQIVQCSSQFVEGMTSGWA